MTKEIRQIYFWEDTFNSRASLLENNTNFRREKNSDTNSDKFRNILNTAAQSEHFGAGFDNHISFKVGEDTYVMRVEIHLGRENDILHAFKLIKILPNYFTKATNPDLNVTTFVISSEEVVEYLKFKAVVEEYIRLKQANNREKVLDLMKEIGNGKRNTDL